MRFPKDFARTLKSRHKDYSGVSSVANFWRFCRIIEIIHWDFLKRVEGGPKPNQANHPILAPALRRIHCSAPEQWPIPPALAASSESNAVVAVQPEHSTAMGQLSLVEQGIYRPRRGG